jgi:hypothetical protein
MATRKTTGRGGNGVKRTRKGSPKPAVAAGPPRPASSTTGRPAAVWFDDEDRGLLRELSVLVLHHQLDSSNSLILRALLRAAPRDERLIEAVRALTERDGRRLRHRKGVSAVEGADANLKRVTRKR